MQKTKSNSSKDGESRELYAQIGRRIRQTRKRIAGLTQEKLAKRVHLTRTSVTNIEKGRQKLLAHTLIEIARELNVSVDQLIPRPPDKQQITEKFPKNFSSGERDFVSSVVSITK